MNIVRRGVAAAALALGVVPAVSAGGPEAGQGAPSSKQPASGPDTPGSQELSWKAQRLELQYRNHMAKLHRLRQIAVERGDTDRVAELDKLNARLQDMHARRLCMVREKMDPEARAHLDEDLADGRDPQQWAQFREKMKAMGAEHREKMQGEREAFRAKAKAENEEFRGDMQDEREAFRADQKERRESRGDGSGAGEFRGRMQEKRSDHREDMQDQREEFRGKMKDQNAEFRDDRRDMREDFRSTARDQRDADRDAARAAHEREWAESRDQVKAGMAGKDREGAIRRMNADRMNDEARSAREEQWRRAAVRDGLVPEGRDRDRFDTRSTRDARGRLHMPTQKEADDLAGWDINDDNADAEFERLRRDLTAP